MAIARYNQINPLKRIEVKEVSYGITIIMNE